jgi:hypothetical protein
MQLSTEEFAGGRTSLFLDTLSLRGANNVKITIKSKKITIKSNANNQNQKSLRPSTMEYRRTLFGELMV